MSFWCKDAILKLFSWGNEEPCFHLISLWGEEYGLLWGMMTTCQEWEVVKVQEMWVTSSKWWGHLSSADGAKGSTHLLAQDRWASGRLSVPMSWNRHLRGSKRSPEWLHFMLVCLIMCQGLTHRQGHKDKEKDLVWQIPNGLWGSRRPVTPPPLSIFKRYFGSPGSCILRQASFSQGLSYSQGLYEEAVAVAPIALG